MNTHLHTKFIQLYTTYSNKLPELSSKIVFPGNNIFEIVDMCYNLDLFINELYLA